MTNRITVGVDLGDQSHSICVLDADGNVIERKTLANTAAALRKYFEALPPALVAMEAGAHSAWVSQLLSGLNHNVVVGNPRKMAMIWNSYDKSDITDAEKLARMARFDLRLLHPIHHRGKAAHADLAIIKSRDMLVKSRSMMIAHARGLVKSVGQRISKCSTESFHTRLNDEMPEELRPALEPLVKIIEELTARIRHYNNLLDKKCREDYPETEALLAISGVGPVTALAFVLTLEDHKRFNNSREVGAFLGLVPRRDQSGNTDKQLRITKAGDSYLRRLLVGSAQYILGPFGPDCDLRRFGLKLAARGGMNGKRRAVVAVARRLAVMMHHLWKTGKTYDAFHRQTSKKGNRGDAA